MSQNGERRVKDGKMTQEWRCGERERICAEEASSIDSCNVDRITYLCVVECGLAATAATAAVALIALCVYVSTLRVDRVYAYISFIFLFFGFAPSLPTRRKRAKTNTNKREDYCAHTNTYTHNRHTRILKAIYFSNQFFLASFCLYVCVFCLISYDFNRSAHHHQSCMCVSVEWSHKNGQRVNTNTGESHRVNTLTSLTWSHASALHGDTYYVATLCRMKTTKRYTRSTHHRWRDDDKDKKSRIWREVVEKKNGVGTKRSRNAEITNWMYRTEREREEKETRLSSAFSFFFSFSSAAGAAAVAVWPVYIYFSAIHPIVFTSHGVRTREYGRRRRCVGLFYFCNTKNLVTSGQLAVSVCVA